MGNIKQYLKFLLKREYRDYIRNLEKDGTIELVRNSEKTNSLKFMILLRRNENVGFFSDYIVFLKEIEYARQRGYIPIVDRKSIKNIFFPADQQVNTWEVFLEQPLQYTIERAYDSGGEICINHIPSKFEPVSLMHCEDMDVVSYWRTIARRYIRFNNETTKFLEEQEKKLIYGKRVLGISVREGYIKLNETEPERLAGHPRQLEIDQILSYTKKYRKLWNCEYIFFTCQTKDVEELLKKEFKDKAICVERNRKSYEELSEGSQIHVKSYEEGYKNELGYITEIYLLSKCTSFMCSENSGSEAAYIMSDGFENFKCIEAGIY